MRGFLTAGALLLIGLSAFAQDRPKAVVDAPRISRAITINGDPSEWAPDAGRIEIREPWQSVKLTGPGRTWDGPEDLSGTIYVAVTDRALLLGGVILDDQVYVHARSPWEGDAIEVFLDTDPTDDPEAYDEDDYQLVLAPLLERNPWTFVRVGSSTSIQDRGADGVRVRGVETRDEDGAVTGYTFEAAIPLVNFPRLSISSGHTIGFNIALVDAEPGPGQKAYLTWNGKSRLTDSPSRFGELRFVQALEDETRATAPAGAGLWRPLLIVLATLALVGLAILLRRRILPIVRLSLRAKLFVAAALAAIYIVSHFAPRMADDLRRDADLEALEERAGALSALPREAQAFGLVRDEGYDEDRRALIRLLDDKTVPLPVERDTLALWARPPKPRRAIGDPTLPFLDYAIPVAPGAPLLIPLGEPEKVETIAFVLSYELTDWARRLPPPTGRTVGRLKAHFENATLVTDDLVYEEEVTDTFLADEDAHPALEPRVVLARRDQDAEGRTTHAVVVPITVPDDAQASRLRALEIQAVGGDGILRIHAVTLRLGERSRALPIGGRSPAGIRYLVRNDRPRGAEVVLRAGDAPLRIDVPGPPRLFDRLWILVALRSGYEARRRYGKPLARVRILDGDTVVSDIPLRSGVHLTAPILWTLDLSASVKSRLAFRWGGNHRDEVEIPVDPARSTTAIEIVRTDGPEAVIVAGVTLGAPRVTSPPAKSVLVAAGDSGTIRLTDAGRRAVAGCAGFAVATSGRILHATSSRAAEARRLEGSSLPPHIRARLEENESDVEIREIGDRQILMLWVPGALPGDALGVWIPFEPPATVHRAALVTGIVSLALFAPLILLCAVDLLGRLRRIRLKLVLAFGMASLVPLVLLFFVMKEALLAPVEEQRRERLQRDAREVAGRLVGMVNGAETAAQKCADDDGIATYGRLLLEDEANGTEELERRLEELSVEIEALRERRGSLSMEIASEQGRRPLLLPRGTEEPMLLGWTPPRSDLVRAWSRLSLKGVSRGAADTLRWTLIVDLPVDRGLLEELKGALGDRLEILLYSPRGYPLAGTLDQTVEGSRVETALKADLVEQIRRTNAPVVHEVDGPGGRYLTAYEVVKDRRNHVVALLATAEPQARAAATRAQIRDLFVGLVAVTLLLEMLIGSLLTRRITGPVLDLERVVREVQRGNLDARAEEAGLTDEVGALTRAFNHMAEELSERLGEMHRLNEGIRDLTTHLERSEVVDAALRLLQEASGAEAIVLLLADRAGDRVELLGTRPPFANLEAGSHAVEGGLIQDALERPEPRHVSDLAATTRRRSGVERALLRGYSDAIVLPLTLGAEVTGAVLLLDREPREAAPDNLPFLSTLAGQVAVSLENARLYRLAIEDGRTGLYVHSYFMARLGEEVDRGLEGNRSLSLLVGALDHYETIDDRYGSDVAQRVFQEVVQRVRGAVRRMYVMGRTGPDGLEILLPEADKRAAMAVAVRVRQAVAGTPIPLDEDGKRELSPTVSLGLASCPEDARSSEFLLSEAERALRRAREDRDDAVIDIESETKRLMGAGDGDFGGFVFRSEKMAEILETVERIARSDISILLRGETGVGKEVIADIIHRRSHRRGQPVVNVNCAALPEALLESELFGHEKGAFTGADRQRLGRFEAAHGGTIFLDEIGEMSLTTQVKILRVLQDKTIERLGGRTPRKVDVRIIAATNRDLPEMIQTGAFREDLYFRLNVVSIVIPPLRQRKEEIPALVDRFMTEFNIDNETGVSEISPEAMDVLYRHPWPGNVRELKNTIERAMVIGDGRTIRPIHLKLEARPGLEASSTVTSAPSRPGAPPPPPPARPESDSGRALTDRQLRILEILRAQRAVSTRECAEMMNVSERTALRDLRDLIARGHVEKTGSRRAALYRLPEEINRPR